MELELPILRYIFHVLQTELARVTLVCSSLAQSTSTQ